MEFVEWGEVGSMIVKKGYTSEQLRIESLGVLRSESNIYRRRCVTISVCILTEAQIDRINEYTEE